jgi:anti-anti-sigma regulatory factor
MPESSRDNREDDRIHRLQHQNDELTRRLNHKTESLEFLQLITKTFVSLSLNDQTSICDTLNSMVTTFMSVKHGVVCLVDAGGAYTPVGIRGDVDESVLQTSEAKKIWDWIVQERVALFLSEQDVNEKWPSAPDFLRGGFACVSIDIGDRVVGIIVFTTRISGEPFSDEDMEFLTAAAGIGSMALTNAQAIAAQQELINDVERQAAEAKREADEKKRAMEELDQKLEIIRRQQFAIQELSTPILQLWDDVLALPVIGVVDSRRSADIMERLLSEVTERQSRFVILDITGVEVVDTKTADHFIKVIKAAELLGTFCILTGIRPAVAQTLVEIGVDMSSVMTLRNLQEGLKECLRRMGQGKSDTALALQ